MKIYKNIFLALSLLILFSSCSKESRKHYAISPQQALDTYISGQDILTVEKLANVLLCKHEGKYQMIDLRTPHEFIENHVPGAINIPAKDVLDMDYYPVLNQDQKINVLYCRGGSQAVDIYMILTQLGFKNIRVALGGFDYINDYLLKQYGVKTGDYYDEKPKYDFLRLVAGVNVPKTDSIEAPKLIEKNPNKVIKDFDEECPDLN